MHQIHRKIKFTIRQIQHHVFACLFCGLLFGSSWAVAMQSTPAVNAVIKQVDTKCALFAESCASLHRAITRIESGDKMSVQYARTALLNCRENYKSIEFFVAYYFKTSAREINGPPKFEAEEPEDDYREPTGLQPIEALLFKHDAVAQKDKLLQLAVNLDHSANSLQTQMAYFHTSDAQLLRSLQLELVTIMTLGITGYDAPLLKSGITESYDAMVAIQASLAPFLASQHSSKLSAGLAATLQYLKAHPDFNTFNRMRFLTAYAMPLQQQLVLYIKQCNIGLSKGGFYNASAKNIFSVDALNGDVFLDFPARKKYQIVLGKQLFFDKRLSGPATRSCATCHRPDRYFTDGLPQSVAIDGHAHVLRNAPTLLYAGYQYSQFWDARANSMVEQVMDVLHNKNEMAGADSLILSRVSRDKKYATLFKAAYPMKIYQQVTMYGIAESLTAYILSLSPRNSDFDRYMAGNMLALNNQQISGFNLFMGKARCGTCHFAPLFNGLEPPFYETSQLEIIGVPQSDSPKSVLADADEGVYRRLPVHYLKGAFKTPTVRNVAKTGPYMHNGSFHTLSKLVDFYNAGGGNGWGLSNSEQTLSSDSLKLNAKEKKAIISFLNSLTDKIAQTTKD